MYPFAVSLDGSTARTGENAMCQNIKTLFNSTLP